MFLTISLAGEQEGGRQQPDTVHKRLFLWISIVTNISFNPRWLNTQNMHKRFTDCTV